ncbi:MAG: hypothetical protein AAB091_05280, partial [Elusimicrobiota bacterium]
LREIETRLAQERNRLAAKLEERNRELEHVRGQTVVMEEAVRSEEHKRESLAQVLQEYKRRADTAERESQEAQARVQKAEEELQKLRGRDDEAPRSREEIRRLRFQLDGAERSLRERQAMIERARSALAHLRREREERIKTSIERQALETQGRALAQAVERLENQKQALAQEARRRLGGLGAQMVQVKRSADEEIRAKEAVLEKAVRSNHELETELFRIKADQQYLLGVKEEIRAKQTALDELGKSHQQLEMENYKIKADYEHLLEIKKSLEVEVGRLMNAVDLAGKTMAELPGVIRQAETSRKEADLKFTEALKIQEEAGRRREAAEQIIAEQNGLKSQFENMRLQFEAAGREIEVLRESEQRLGVESQALKKDLQAMALDSAGRRESLEGALQEKDRKLDQLKKDRIEAEERLSFWAAEKKASEELLRKAREQLDAYEREAQAGRQAERRMAIEIEQVKKEAGLAHESLERAVEENRRSTLVKEEETRLWQSRALALGEELSALKTRFVRLEQELADAHRQCAASVPAEQAARLKEDLRQMEENRRALQETMENLRKSNQGEIVNLEKAVSDQRAAYEQRLAEAQAALAAERRPAPAGPAALKAPAKGLARRVLGWLWKPV